MCLGKWQDVLVGPVEVGPHHHHDRHHDQEGIRGQADGGETVEQVGPQDGELSQPGASLKTEEGQVETSL